MATDPRIERHYTSDAIAERILAALREASGRDVAITPDTLAPLDHFHGRGLAATKALAQALAPRPGEHLLDIGCGIGGPARWFAATFGCKVTGIDLTEAFCRAAEAPDRSLRPHPIGAHPAGQRDRSCRSPTPRSTTPIRRTSR